MKKKKKKNRWLAPSLNPDLNSFLSYVVGGEFWVKETIFGAGGYYINSQQNPLGFCMYVALRKKRENYVCEWKE